MRTREPAGGDVGAAPSRRSLTRLDPADGASYARAVSALVPAIEARLGPDVMANRALGRGAFEDTTLESWVEPRRAFHRELRRLASRGDVTMIDVFDCYGSIRPRTVESALRRFRRGDSARVLRLLGRFEDAGVRGLPVGPQPSAILANAVLFGLDRALDRAGVRHVRWVDDIALASSDEASARRALGVAVEALDALGLALNDRKTRVLPAETLRCSASALALSRPGPRALPYSAR
jgi:hypothetical protein